jgi:hypothetical protein
VAAWCLAAPRRDEFAVRFAAVFFDRRNGGLRVKSAAMTIQAAVADTSNKTVTFGGKTYSIQPLAEDSYTVLLAGIPVGRVVYSFGAANGVPEGSAISEDDLYAIAEAWFAAVDG